MEVGFGFGLGAAGGCNAVCTWFAEAGLAGALSCWGSAPMDKRYASSSWSMMMEGEFCSPRREVRTHEAKRGTTWKRFKSGVVGYSVSYGDTHDSVSVVMLPAYTGVE